MTVIAMSQLPLAEQAADEAVKRVGDHAPVPWMERALLAVRYVSHREPYFTTDDIWAEVGSPPEPRAMGAVMRRAAAKGLCRPTERYRHSTRVECHARPVRVWEAR